MPTIELKLRRPHLNQKQIIAEAARFNVVDCGRRFGKTVLGEDRLFRPALHGYPVAWFSPTYKMLLEVWREVRALLAPITLHHNSQERRIELVTGGVVEMWSLENPDAGRSRKYKRVVVDEAAMAALLGQTWQESIRPTLTDYEGDAWFFSTPKGRNFFWQIFEWGQDPLKPEWKSWKMPTSANPFIKLSEIEAAREELPERVFAQEYLAEFLDDAGGVFRHVAKVATLKRLDKGDPDKTYIGGVDWARSNDFTVFSIMDSATKQQVALDRFNQIDYEIQLQRFQALHERFKPRAWIAEENAMGGPLIERLRRMGYPVQPFVTTNATKMQIVDALALAVERQEIGLLNDPVQIAELQAYEMERLPSGLIRYSAPEGMHDDTVIAVALNLYGCQSGGGSLFR